VSHPYLSEEVSDNLYSKRRDIFHRGLPLRTNAGAEISASGVLLYLHCVGEI